MAVVRITKELKSSVRDIARATFGDAIRAAENDKPEDRWGPYIYDKIYGEYYHKMKELPREFFRYSDTIDVSRVGDILVSRIFTLGEPRPVPPVPVSKRDIAESRHNGGLDLKHCDEFREIEEEYRQYMDKYVALRRKRAEFVANIGAVLDNFTTLAPALKAWPPLWDLLPDYYKDKHKEVVERTPKEKDNPSLDKAVLDKLTGVVVAKKLGGL